MARETKLTPAQYRLDADAMAAIGLIADHLTEITGSPASNAAAVRFAVRETAAKIVAEKKSKKIDKTA